MATSAPSERFQGALHELVHDPSRAGLFCDFDGTLSEIVAEPHLALPVAGAAELLTELAGVLGRVAVLSGRPVSFVGEFFPTVIDVAGLYGLETRIGGARHDHPQAGMWREVVADVVGAGRDGGPAGMRVESKGLSLTLHYRGMPELAPAVQQWAAQQAARSGLLLRTAKMSFELHPPIEADKGTTLAGFVAGLRSVVFVGDDVGDVPAFDALDRMRAAGIATTKVAVLGAEPAAALVDRADVVVDDPAGIVELLRSITTAIADQRV